MFKRFALLTVVLAVSALSLVGCGDYLTGGMLDNDPNRVFEAEPKISFVAIQGQMFLQYNGHLNRGVNIWMEQLCGVARQYAGLAAYSNGESEFNGEFNVYSTGGLIDIRRALAKTVEGGNQQFTGILQVWEAFVIGMQASLWGDIPYSQAVDEEYPTPQLDGQAAVYQAVQSLLDQAISNLDGDDGVVYATPKSEDFVYGGDTDKWKALAYTLKARFYMHWAKVDKATNLAAAKTAAMNGITSVDNNFRAVFTGAPNEENMFYQYQRSRSGYMVAGFHMIDEMNQRNDPRVPLYFSTNADGIYRGSQPAESDQAASNVNPATFGSADWDLNMVTAEENHFILAECYYKLDGDEAAAIAEVNAAIDKIWTYYDLTDNKPDLTGLTGEALFKEIMYQKYFANFLMIETYNDWKRTNYPDVSLGLAHAGKPTPRRPLYSDTERNANPNIPDPDSQVLRNANDPDVVY